MSIQLRIAGRPTPTEEASAAVRGASLSGRRDQPDTRLLDAVNVLGAFEMYQKDRAASQKSATFEAEDDDLIEFVLEDGVSVWMSVAAYRERQRRLKPGRQTTKELDIDPAISLSASSRGMVSDIVTGAVRILRLKRDEVWEQAKDPTQWPDWVKQHGVTTFDKLGAWLTAKLIIWLIERKIRPEEGLYCWVKPSAENSSSLVAPGSIPSDTHILLFIHGTASNTEGSFGALHTDDASSEWESLTRTFKDNVYAFEHRTMSQSPIENALVLANALPDGARLSLVSHSRGGQVADLLCLEGLTPEQVNRYHREASEARRADPHDRRQLEELAKVLRQKKFQIVRVIRVACPAQGTLLASENLDRFLSVLTSLIGLIPVVGQSPIYQVVKRITLEVAKSRWNPSVLPGLESMIPESPLVALLNAPDLKGGGVLGVIAGDIEGVSWFKRLGTFMTDTFIYDNQDNDLVVNTNSMFQGLPRDTSSRYIFDQGADVSHFHYFRNARTRHLLVQSITSSGNQWPVEFRLLEEAKVAPVPMLRSIQTRSGVSQPVVFVLPGIMGSELQANGEDVWLKYLSLFRGHIEKISMGAPNVTVSGLVSTYYRDLCEYLADTHEVIPFGYDWRGSITQAATQLADEVKKVVARTREPIRLIAHSMGGLVVRRFIQDNPDLWKAMCEREGARFVMLGTPNRGSYDMVESLAGMAKTVKQLALLDVTHSMSEIVAFVAAYQGALELLPQEDWAYFTHEKWKDLHPLTASEVQIKPQILQAAKAALIDLPERIPHAERVRYVAGWAPKTVCGVKVENQRLSFQATTAGDGRVTYKAGLLPDIPVWYVDAEHGDLADHKPAFPAYRDLLERGVTNQLSTTPLSADRGGESIFDYEHEPVLYPTASDFEAGLLGKRRKALKVRTSEKLQVSVMHGDLTHTNHPVLLSHYQGDTIFGSERVVDRLVGNALSQRYNLGRYPGRTGTVAVVLTQPNDVQTAFRIRHGAIVIGLGKWGELTPSALTQAVHQGVMEYCVQFAQCCGSTESPTVSTGLTINSLLIGSNTSANIAVEDSVNAIVRGVILANRALMEQNPAFPRIAHIQFIELYLDVAIDAAKTAHRVAKRIERDLQAEIDVASWLKKGIGGLTRLVPSSTRGYWRRWTVSAVHEAPAPVPFSLPPVLKDRLRAILQEDKAKDPQVWNALLDLAFRDCGPAPRRPRKLRFLALSDRARAEVTVQETQPELIAQLIQRSITSTAFRRDIAKTLFELLIPLDLKDSLLNQDRVVFVLDEVAANYPWELMIDVDQPLCIRIGMIRQLETVDYEERIRDTTSTNVYVVGDPLTPSNYPALPGAQREAELVASLLKPHYAVNHSSQRLGALEVLNQLFAQPYRIIHIAGHGYYNDAETDMAGAKAGVVLDNGLFLTAAEIAKLDPIPELVFLNCCYLGQIGGTAYNKMAASISRELIRKGVRAVVAAGWPVRDDAALCFAQVFYKKLLDSQPFGLALKEARQQTWSLFPESNTWGAYQAYGDPDFRLRQNHAVQTGNNEDVTVAAEEVLIALDGLVRQDEEPDLVTLQKKLVDLKGKCAVDWLKQGNVQEQFGKVYGEHRLFQEAVEHYRQAVGSEDSENPATLRGIEQWINLEARFGRKNNDKAGIKKAIRRGRQVLKIAETSERLSIMGSAYKRLAELDEKPSEITTHLAKAAAYYQKAAKKQEQEPLADPYPIVNWMMIEALLGTSKVPYESWLSKAEILARQRFQTTRKAWDLFSVADIAIIRAYLKGALPAERGTLIENYRKIFAESSATKREQDSALGQLDFMITIWKKLSRSGHRKKAVDSIGDALNDIRNHLEQSKPQAKPSPIQPKGTGRPSRTSKASAKQPARKKTTRRSKHHRKG